MALRIDNSLLVFLLLLICLSSAEGFWNKANPMDSLHKGGLQVNPRKLLVLGVMDYDYTGPNPKHDPPKEGKPPPSGGGSGGGGRNP